MATVVTSESPTAWATWRQQMIDTLMAMPESLARPRMTYEEFLAWADEDTLAEWVDGEVVMYSPASNRHQDVVDFLVSVLRPFVEMHQLGIVRSAPFQMKLEHGREPDLLFVTQEHLGRLKQTHLDGPANLVVEIVSPESVGRDRGEKFYEYAQGGVPEYWLLDPETRWAEFYRLEGDRYRLAYEGREGEYRSLVVPGFWLRVEWLWQEPLPNPLRVLGEIAGVDPQVIQNFMQALRGIPQEMYTVEQAQAADTSARQVPEQVERLLPGQSTA
jgi:Uma2 family endonuclease